jgi:hypothetical protein
VIENALAPKPTPTPKNDEKDDGTTSNPVVQGAKGIGKGFKRLFGGK